MTLRDRIDYMKADILKTHPRERVEVRVHTYDDANCEWFTHDTMFVRPGSSILDSAPPIVLLRDWIFKIRHRIDLNEFLCVEVMGMNPEEFGEEVVVNWQVVDSHLMDDRLVLFHRGSNNGFTGYTIIEVL